MRKLNSIIDITLRVTGKNLNPSCVSQALSMEPDRQWKRGDTVVLHGNRRSSPKKSGLWAISHKEIDINDIVGILESLAVSINKADPPLNKLVGWESTNISINIGSRESEASIEWILNADLMALLAAAKVNLVVLTY